MIVEEDVIVKGELGKKNRRYPALRDSDDIRLLRSLPNKEFACPRVTSKNLPVPEFRVTSTLTIGLFYPIINDEKKRFSQGNSKSDMRSRRT